MKFKLSCIRRRITNDEEEEEEEVIDNSKDGKEQDCSAIKSGYRHSHAFTVTFLKKNAEI